ncbi:hypothetical protein [Bacillus thuringiensis]|uniref:hypothetical protein n=1 Tax=Bacillus thuringiensis TaxID=1428 RepID=UPI001643480E|nr:hypothetical protein [Bacillus thuringiensis]
MENFERRRRLDGLREGNRINVFSGGDQINGKGIFIRIDSLFGWMLLQTLT